MKGYNVEVIVLEVVGGKVVIMGKDILVILLVYWFISTLEIDNIWLIEVIVEDVKGNLLNCE